MTEVCKNVRISVSNGTGNRMNKEKDRDFEGILKQNEIFGCLDESSIEKLCKSRIRHTYHRGEYVRGHGNNFGGIGFIESGRLSVIKGRMIISTLESGTVFGAAELFNNPDREMPDIKAPAECSVIEIPGKEVIRLFESNPGFSRAYAAYLTDRIFFLTEKIDEVTCGTGKDKLLNLLAKDKMLRCKNMTALAKKLDIGRATLYRALSELEQNGIIERNENEIKLLR